MYFCTDLWKTISLGEVIDVLCNVDLTDQYPACLLVLSGCACRTTCAIFLVHTSISMTFGVLQLWKNHTIGSTDFNFIVSTAAILSCTDLPNICRIVSWSSFLMEELPRQVYAQNGSIKCTNQKWLGFHQRCWRVKAEEAVNHLWWHWRYTRQMAWPMWSMNVLKAFHFFKLRFPSTSCDIVKTSWTWPICGLPLKSALQFFH